MLRLAWFLLFFPLLANAAVPSYINDTVAKGYFRPNATGQDMNSSSLRWDFWVATLNTSLATGTAYIDGSGNLAVDTTVSPTELGYLNGVTAALQTQLDGKQASGNYITSLTGDLTASGPGAAASTIANDAVSNAKAANMAQSTIKGRAAGAGTGDPTDLTPAQAQAITGSVVQVLTEQTTPSAPASGTMAVYPKSDGKLYKQTSAGVESEVGSGGGSGGLNIATLNTAGNSWAVDKLTNADLETSVGDWVAYADAAATTPVDLTGGSPNTTCARSTSSPLNGTGSLLITVTTGASRQGEGCSLVVNIPTAYRGKAIKVYFPYETTGTIAAGDFVPYAYDVTNSSLLAPSATVSGISGAAGIAHAQFTTQTSTAQLRIGLHIARTSTAAATIKLDDFKVEPDVTQANVPMSDWQQYTPTFTGFGTVTVHSMWWRRVGDSVEIRGRLTSGTTTATEARMSLPNGLVVDGTKVSVISHVGDVATDQTGMVILYTLAEPNVSYLTFGYQYGSAGGLTKQNGSSLFGPGFYFSFSAKVPISGWSSGGGTSPILSLSDWTEEGSSFTVNGGGTVSAQSAYTRRVGDTLHVKLRWVNGTVAASTYSVTLPSKYRIDVSKLSSATDGTRVGVLSEARNSTTNSVDSSYWNGAAFYDGSTTNTIYFTFRAAGNKYEKVDGNAGGTSNAQMFVEFSIPISGWTSTSAGTLTSPRCELWVKTTNGYGSTANKIRRWTTTVTNTGDCVTYADSAADGGSFTFTREGLYSVCYGDVFNAAATMGISLNSNQLTTDFLSITNAHGIASMSTGGNEFGGNVCAKRKFSAGDVVRAHTGGAATGGNTIHAMFRITQEMH